MNWGWLVAGETVHGKALCCSAMVVVASLVALISRWFFQSKPPPVQAKYKAGNVTLETLAQHAGFDYTKPILLAVCGKVFDVTDAADKYGPGRPLNVYAGREISRALALDSVAAEELGSTDISELCEEAKQRLAVALAEIEAKFDHVGQVVAPREMTLEELAQHDGVAVPGAPLYLSILGVVFDVSKGSQFYGPEGVYPFAGKECARALALMSTEPADCCDRCDDLSQPEKDTLRDWRGRFTTKYPIIGRLVPTK